MNHNANKVNEMNCYIKLVFRFYKDGDKTIFCFTLLCENIWIFYNAMLIRNLSNDPFICTFAY